MRGQRSPYTTLGLRPGADRAAVDEAYRRLMKLHHPDLPGGDADQAAEINRAYAALKEQAPPTPLPALIEKRQWFGRRSKRPGRLAGMLMLAAAAGALLLLPLPSPQGGVRRDGDREGSIARAGPGLPDTFDLRSLPDQDREGSIARAGPGLPDTFDLRSLPDQDAIATAVAAAARLNRNGRDEEAVEFSRSCDDDLRTFPGPSLLDHCVAFDAAIGMLRGDSAPARFRAEDMAARHVGAALRVSDDPVLAEERIGNVRREVEKMLVTRP